MVQPGSRVGETNRWGSQTFSSPSGGPALWLGTRQSRRNWWLLLEPFGGSKPVALLQPCCSLPFAQVVKAIGWNIWQEVVNVGRNICVSTSGTQSGDSFFNSGLCAQLLASINWLVLLDDLTIWYCAAWLDRASCRTLYPAVTCCHWEEELIVRCCVEKGPLSAIHQLGRVVY